MNEYQQQDPTGWLLSEKRDGVFSEWTGTELVSRNGVKFNAPAWFTASLPAFRVQGELWAGRGNFHKVVSTLGKASPVDSDWRGLSFVVFEVPDATGGIAERLASYSGDKITLTVCEGAAHLAEYFKAIVSGGGEGVVIRNRSAKFGMYAVQKIKPVLTDEATVISCDGKVIVTDWNGITVKLLVTRLIPAGVRVTFSYNGKTHNGFPRHAQFIEVRNYE